MKQFLNLYTILILLLITLSFIKCGSTVKFEEYLSKSDIKRIDDLVSQYGNDTQPKYDEITKIKNEKIKVSAYNIIFNIQYYFFNLKKKRADLALSNLKLIKLNNKRSKSFLKSIDLVEYYLVELNRGYVELSKTVNNSNKVFNDVLRLLKTAIYIFICIIITVVAICLISVGIYYYIQTQKYDRVSQQDEKKYKLVKVIPTQTNANDKNKVDYIGINESKTNIKVE